MKVPRITQEEVDQYVSVAAQYNLLEKRKEAMRNRIIEALDAGHEIPTDGPYLLVVQPSDRPPSWKDICLSYIATLGKRSQAKALKFIEGKLLAKEPSISLVSKPNPNWRSKAQAA